MLREDTRTSQILILVHFSDAQFQSYAYFIDALLAQICDRCTKQIGTVIEVPETTVALEAQDPAYLPRDVIVVDVVGAFRRWGAADLAVRDGEQAISFLTGDPVLAARVVFALRPPGLRVPALLLAFDGMASAALLAHVIELVQFLDLMTL
jgi:hypothetical protein